MDYFLNASDAKQATGNLRKFQEQDVELLKEFIRICEEYEEEEIQIVKSNNNENIVLKIISNYGFLEKILAIL